MCLTCMYHQPFLCFEGLGNDGGIMEPRRLLGAGRGPGGFSNGRPAQDTKYGGIHGAGEVLAKRGVLGCQHAVARGGLRVGRLGANGHSRSGRQELKQGRRLAPAEHTDSGNQK